MSPRRWNVAVAALAIAHLVAGALLDSGWFFSKYVDAASLLSRGVLDGEAATDFSVGYLWLHTVASPLGIRWGQSLVGAVAVFSVARLARRMAGRWSGLFAAAALALHPTVLAYEVTLEPDSFIAAFTVIGVELVLRTRPRTGLVGCAFALLGLAAALRPTSWLPFVWLGVIALRRRRGRRAVWAAVSLGIALAVLPVAWRAHFIGGEVSATMSVGQVAFVGNRPEGTGVGAVTPSALKLLEQQFLSPERPDYAHVLFRRFAREAVSGEGAAAEGYWLQLVAAFAREEPSGFLAQLTRKASWFLAGPIAHDIRGVRTMEARVREVLPVDPAWLAICGLAGLVLRARRRTARVLLATEALWLVLALVFYVTGRYALPSLVLLTAGFGPFVRALARPRAWRRGALLPAGVAVTLFAAWASHEWAFGPLLAAGAEAREGLSAFHEARRTGNEARARAGWIDAVGAQPLLLMTADLVGFPPDAPELAFAAGASRATRIARDTELDRLALAQLAVTAGRCDEVKAALVELQDWPGWSMFDVPLAAWTLQVTCALRAGRPEEAAAAVDRALAQRPGALFALAHALAAERALPGRPRSARSRLESLHDPVSVAWAVTQAALAWGDLPLADERSAELVRRLPDGGLAWALRGQVLARRGDDEGALDALGRACTLAPRQVFPVAAFEPVIQRALTDDASPERWSLAGELSFRAGRWGEATMRWRRAESLWGPSVPAWHRGWVSRFAPAPAQTP